MSNTSAVPKPVYEVVSPLGEPIAEKTTTDPRSGFRAGKIVPAAPVADLNSKKIGLIWAAFTNGDVFLEAVAGWLAERFKGLQFGKLPAGRGLHWGDHPHESIAELAKEAGLDAAIAAVGG